MNVPSSREAYLVGDKGVWLMGYGKDLPTLFLAIRYWP